MKIIKKYAVWTQYNPTAAMFGFDTNSYLVGIFKTKEAAIKHFKKNQSLMSADKYDGYVIKEIYMEV